MKCAILCGCNACSIRGNGEVIKRVEFEQRKAASEAARLARMNKKPKRLASHGRDVEDFPMLQVRNSSGYSSCMDGLGNVHRHVHTFQAKHLSGRAVILQTICMHYSFEWCQAPASIVEAAGAALAGLAIHSTALLATQVRLLLPIAFPPLPYTPICIFSGFEGA